MVSPPCPYRKRTSSPDPLCGASSNDPYQQRISSQRWRRRSRSGAAHRRSCGATTGPSSSEEALRTFCEDQVGIGYVPPGQPWKNGYIESFNNRVRDECLNMNEFHSLLEARVVIEDWKEDYNNRHRHSSLAYRTPNEYAASCIHTY
ncbi:transposase InsO family protein [Rhodococcus sp. 27YEA15]